MCQSSDVGIMLFIQSSRRHLCRLSLDKHLRSHYQLMALSFKGKGRCTVSSSAINYTLI